MKALRLIVALLTAASVAGVDTNQATDMLVNLLSQFLSSQAVTERVNYYTRPSAPSSGILPKILHPQFWIPNFDNIPFNPDSELTTVSLIILQQNL